jgi:diketogulonate reductase-like aldo/keto reductase
MTRHDWNRRDLIRAGALLASAPHLALAAQSSTLLTNTIPGSGERLPAIGLGTYSVFDVDSTAAEIAQKKEILRLLTSNGGSVVDSSPMYRRAEKVVGDIIKAGSDRDRLFLATKVWTDGKDAGVAQMQRSARLMNSKSIDLMQVHNLRDTATHMASIRDRQDAGLIRYSGLTHYTAAAHSSVAKEMRRFKPDFIQINYSLGELEAGERLLPMAHDLGVAVLINRPFQSGRLFQAVAGKEIPDWATSFATTWGQFFLKFIISHPAVTAAIPATSKPQHMIDNMLAGHGTLPDPAMRRRMVNFSLSL